MATLKELRNERLRKLEALKELGVNSYPARTTRTHELRAIHQDFSQLGGLEVNVAGRITTIRKFGKIAFIVIKDATGTLQLFLSAGQVAGLEIKASQLGFEQLPLLDSGDFIEAAGKVIKTKTGEISVDVVALRLLTKSLRPLPITHDGFTNKEERLRRRYVDTNVNPKVYQRYIRRSQFWQATRRFLMDRDFVEINIPVLENTTGGADATPFVTHMDALGQDFYLRISHELPLKRLLVGGYEKVFDIGPRFRNENYSDEHLPEHVAMEWYWAYADWQMGMELTEKLTRFVVDKTWGTRQFKLLNGQEVDLGPDSQPWPRISFVETIREHFRLDVFSCTLEEVQAELNKHNVEVEKQDNRARGIDKLWKKIRVTLPGPAFLVNIPTFLQPLAKTQPDNPELTEQFNLILGGTEACKAYSELNDPLDQLNRFKEQQALRDAGDDEAQMMDIDYVEALEYAMPPACGFGWSERLFWMLEGVTAREGVPFPQLRREVDELTKAIYPDLRPERVASAAAQPVAGLPLSAAEQGTRKLYLDDYTLQVCEAVVRSAHTAEDGQLQLVLDQTCAYPGGGGQLCDLGEITWGSGKLVLTEVTKNKEGIVAHTGHLQGVAPQEGQTVQVSVDPERRLYNSRLHSAGHLIDYALHKIGKDWIPGKGSHFPDRSFVEYSGEFDPEESEELARRVERLLDDYIHRGGEVTPSRVPNNEARANSKYIPEHILSLYQNIHIARYPGGFSICCGGTHIADVSQLGHVVITKIKKKNGNIRVSYTLES